MGKITNGITGGFSGSVGPVVGVQWNGVNIMRSKPTFKKKRVYSQKQLNNQQQFAAAANFANSLTRLLDITFRNFAIKKTGRSAAISYLLKRALSGSSNAYALDYAKALISRGDLPGAENAFAYTGETHTIAFTWADNSHTRYAKDSDKVIVVVHCPALKSSLYAITDATRNSGMVSMDAAAFKGHTVHTWLGFLSTNGKEVSDSVYTGALVLA